MNEEQKKFYQDNGYIVIPDIVTDDEIVSMKERITKLIDDFFNDPASKSTISIFSTENQTKYANDYFIQSGDKIRFFFEENAFDKDGNLVVERSKSINKIGHALADLDPVFEKFSFQQKVKQLALDAGMEDPLIAQSMYIFKQPRIGGKVATHQDSTFVNTKPLSCQALWFALEDVTLTNGCLWVVPGSHKEGIVTRFKRNKEGTGIEITEADKNEAASWKSLREQFDKSKNPEKWVPLPCKKGSVVLINGSVVHMSEVNESEFSRHVYTFHMVDRPAEYSPENWLQRDANMPFRGFS